MKTSCQRCDGNGEIQCPECGGNGELETDIEKMTLRVDMENYIQLLEFQNDARRVIRQCRDLSTINPSHSKSYEEQLAGCLSIINRQAEKAQRRPKK